MKKCERACFVAFSSAMLLLSFSSCERNDDVLMIQRKDWKTVSIEDAIWDEINSKQAFYAPWDGLTDHTVFQCFASADSLFFRYEVEDSSITLTDPFLKEADVEPEDRVEIFFSPDLEMKNYKCAEMDPCGRVLDYQASYYRIMDYDWDFQTLKLESLIHDDRYIVFGRVSLVELEELGNDLHGGFWMGVFRADFHRDGTVNWYSMKPTDDRSPDFHKSNVLFKARIEKQ